MNDIHFLLKVEQFETATYHGKERERERRVLGVLCGFEGFQYIVLLVRGTMEKTEAQERWQWRVAPFEKTNGQGVLGKIDTGKEGRKAPTEKKFGHQTHVTLNTIAMIERLETDKTKQKQKKPNTKTISFVLGERDHLRGYDRRDIVTREFALSVLRIEGILKTF